MRVAIIGCLDRCRLDAVLPSVEWLVGQLQNPKLEALEQPVSPQADRAEACRASCSATILASGMMLSGYELDS